MAYEVIPFTDTEIEDLSVFEKTILQQIENRGNQNGQPIDRYNPQQVKSNETWWQERSDGGVNFANLWLIHSLDVGERALTYAHLPKTIFKVDEAFKVLANCAGEPEPEDSTEPLDSTARFYVTEFNSKGAESRTCFSEYAGSIVLHRTSRFGESDGSVTQLTRPLDKLEAVQLIKVVCSPEESASALDDLMKLSPKDKRTIKKANKDHDKRMQEYHDTMESISRAHHNAIQDMHRNPTILRGV
jgi:hypothetical protein